MSVQGTLDSRLALKYLACRFILILPLAFTFALLPVGPTAEAHAVLERSVPAASQSLESSPGLLELWFTEPPEHSQTVIRLLDADGNAIPLGAVQAGSDPLYASSAIQRVLSPGIYTVVYDNLSKADGHRWQGFFPFVVLNPDGTAPAATPLPAELRDLGRTSVLPGTPDVLLKAVSLIAAVVIVGAAVAHLLVVRPTNLPNLDNGSTGTAVSQHVLLAWTRLAGAVLLIGAGAQALLFVSRLGGFGDLGEILFETRAGILSVARIALACVVVVSAVTFARSSEAVSRCAPWLLLICSLAAIASYSLGSHAAATPVGGDATSVLSDFIHFVATGLWLGVLAHITVVWRLNKQRLDDDEQLILTANLFDRFSALAMASVAVLLVSGLFNALTQVPSWSALLDTTYGLVLLIKIGLVVPLLAVAAVNAFFLKPAIVDAIDSYTDEDADDEAEETSILQSRLALLKSRLTRTMTAELLLGVLVLTATAVLTQTGTSRGEIAQERAEERAVLAGQPRQHETYVFGANKLADDLAVAFRVDPQLIGINRLEVRLTSAEGREVGTVEEVSLRFFYADPAFGSTNNIPVTFDSVAPTGELVYQLEGPYFSIGGGYRVQVDVRRTGMSDARAIFPLEVGESPESKRSDLDFPFYIGDRNTTGAILLFVTALGLVLWRSQLGLLAPRLKPGAQVAAGVLFAASVFLTSSAVLSPHRAEGQRNPVPLTAESVERGAILFANNCASCHGDTGRGDGPAGVNLRPQPADFLVHVPYHSDETLFGWVTSGVGGTGMPAWADQLSEKERWDLINFLRENFGDEFRDQDATPPAGGTP